MSILIKFVGAEMDIITKCTETGLDDVEHFFILKVTTAHLWLFKMLLFLKVSLKAPSRWLHTDTQDDFGEAEFPHALDFNLEVTPSPKHVSSGWHLTDQIFQIWGSFSSPHSLTYTCFLFHRF